MGNKQSVYGVGHFKIDNIDLAQHPTLQHVVAEHTLFKGHNQYINRVFVPTYAGQFVAVRNDRGYLCYTAGGITVSPHFCKKNTVHWTADTCSNCEGTTHGLEKNHELWRDFSELVYKFDQCIMHNYVSKIN